MGLNHFFCAGLIMDYGRMVSVFEHFLGYMILKNHWGVVVWARLIEIFFVKLICFYEVFWGFLIQSSYFCQDFHVFFISIFYQSMCLAFFCTYGNYFPVSTPYAIILSFSIVCCCYFPKST